VESRGDGIWGHVSPFARLQEGAEGSSAAPEVEVVSVTQKDVPIYSEYVGLLMAL